MPCVPTRSFQLPPLITDRLGLMLTLRSSSVVGIVVSLPYTPLYETGVGAVVTSVAEGSSFRRALRPGMRIISLQVEAIHIHNTI